MPSSYYRQQWENIKDQPDNQAAVGMLARQIAYSFLDDYVKNCVYEDPYIELLCQMTSFSNDPDRSDPAALALFSIIVERLCDDFEELQTVTYNKVMTQVISFCSNLPAGRELGRRLDAFGLNSQELMLARIENIRADQRPFPAAETVQKILVLSRVTIGADVAVTSVIMQRLAKAFPEAKIVLIGAGKLEDVYAGNPRIKIRTVAYSRRGGLLERLSVWHTVLEVIESEIKGTDSKKSGEGVILVDPDSRLSQLGVLPLIEPHKYFFFESRSDVSFYSNLSMAQLANSWLDNLTGRESFAYPKVWPPDSLEQPATLFCKQILKSTKKIVTVNFGVGGNDRKRVGRLVEEKILLEILEDDETTVLLDKGFGEEELARNNRLMEAVGEQGHAVIDAKLDTKIPESFKGGLIGIESRIGEMAGLIKNSHEYIGYDSACQHIAAAVETHCVTIFAGSNNMRFIRRWSAHSPVSSSIIHVDTLTDPGAVDVEGILVRLRHARKRHNSIGKL